MRCVCTAWRLPLWERCCMPGRLRPHTASLQSSSPQPLSISSWLMAGGSFNALCSIRSQARFGVNNYACVELYMSAPLLYFNWNDNEFGYLHSSEWFFVIWLPFALFVVCEDRRLTTKSRTALSVLWVYTDSFVQSAAEILSGERISLSSCSGQMTGCSSWPQNHCSNVLCGWMSFSSLLLVTKLSSCHEVAASSHGQPFKGIQLLPSCKLCHDIAGDLQVWNSSICC